MKCRIDEKQNDLDVSVENIQGKRDKLLKVFEKCREGRCPCVTGEYKKLDSIEIKHSEESITLHLKAKAGTRFDKSKIESCVKRTVEKAWKDGEAD